MQASIIPTTAIQERFLTNLLICNTKISRGIFGSSSKLHLTLVEKAQAGSGHSSLVPTNTFPIMFKSYFIPPSRKCVPFVTTCTYQFIKIWTFPTFSTNEIFYHSIWSPGFSLRSWGSGTKHTTVFSSVSLFR